MVTLAHAGHVLVDSLLFGSPVVVLALGLWWMGRQERRREAREQEPAGQPAA